MSSYLNTTATQYMKQVNMSAKWIDTLTSSDEQVFTSKKDWDNYLDNLGCKAVHQRRWATEGALKVTAHILLARFSQMPLQPSKNVVKAPETANLPAKYEQLRSAFR